MKPSLDIDSLRTEHESDEQWAVRRSFMEEHKDKFSESELVTLAQLFTNIEFLGCRYMMGIMEDMHFLGNKIIQDRQRTCDHRRPGGGHWSEEYPYMIAEAKLTWITMDVYCLKHRKSKFCGPIKVKMDVDNDKETKNSDKSDQVDASKTSDKEEKNFTQVLAKYKDESITEKVINHRTGKVIDKSEKKNKKVVIKAGKPKDDIGKFLEVNKPKSSFDFTNFNVKKINRDTYNKNKYKDTEDEFINMFKEKKQSKYPARRLHSFLTDFSHFVVCKENGEKIVDNDMPLIMDKIEEILKDFQIPNHEFTYVGMVNAFAGVYFSIKSVDKDMASKILQDVFEGNGNLFVFKQYNKVMSALLIPEEQKYNSVNVLKWLKYQNEYMKIKFMHWNVLNEYTFDGFRRISVNIPMEDAIALNKYNYKLNYLDIKVKLILYPKSKRKLELNQMKKAVDRINERTDHLVLECKRDEGAGDVTNKKVTKAEEDSDLSIKSIMKNEEIGDSENLSTNEDPALADNPEDEEKFDFENNERVILSLADETKFRLLPLFFIKKENKDEDLNFDDWQHIFMDNFFREKLILSMPKADALKLKRKVATLTYYCVKLKARFPDM